MSGKPNWYWKDFGEEEYIEISNLIPNSDSEKYFKMWFLNGYEAKRGTEWKASNKDFSLFLKYDAKIDGDCFKLANRFMVELHKIKTISFINRFRYYDTDKFEATSLERFGTKHPSSCNFVKKKVQSTVLERYGVTNVSKDTSIKNKKIQTSLEHYGVENVTQSPEVKAKIRETCFEKYGVGASFEAESVKAKIISTNLERYGVTVPSKSEEVKQKTRSTFVERYGGVGMASEILKNKMFSTNLKRYGVKSQVERSEFKENLRKHLLEKYGVEHYWQTEESRNKWRSKCLESYGVPYVPSSIAFQRIYGVSNPSELPEIIEIKRKNLIEKYGVPYNPEGQEKSSETFFNNHGFLWGSKLLGHVYCVLVEHPIYGKLCKIGYGNTWRRWKCIELLDSVSIISMVETLSPIENPTNLEMLLQSQFRDFKFRIERKISKFKEGNNIFIQSNGPSEWFKSEIFEEAVDALNSATKCGDTLEGFNRYWECHSIEILDSTISSESDFDEEFVMGSRGDLTDV